MRIDRARSPIMILVLLVLTEMLSNLEHPLTTEREATLKLARE